MKTVSGLKAWLTAAAIGCAVLSCPAAELSPIAHSAQLTLEAETTPTGLVLRVRPAAASAAALSVTELTVSVDGKSAPVTSRADGSFFVPLASESAHESKLDVVVTHDGVREVLSGTLALPATAPAPSGALGALRNHKQIAWWILNIAVVLIGAIAISRRMS